MYGPHNQVSRLRVPHTLKILVPGVKLERACIWIVKTRIEIRLMNKVRTILCATLLLIPRGVRDRPPFLQAQQSGVRHRALCSGWCLGVCRGADRRDIAASQARREDITANRTPVEFLVRVSHRPFVLDSCPETAFPSLRKPPRTRAGNGTCSERNWPNGQSPNRLQIRWAQDWNQFVGAARGSGRGLIHSYLDRCGGAGSACRSRDGERGCARECCRRRGP